jgi:hypothetical protein
MDDRELESLTNEIMELCGYMDAAEFRLLELIRRLDESAPWGAWSMKSCAHWLNWRRGIALGAARKEGRVAHALVALSAISAAFREGRLSYSKVRAITRVATPDMEWERPDCSYILSVIRPYPVLRRSRGNVGDGTRPTP